MEYFKKKIVIFEGVDGAGKSTIARIVAKRLGAVLIHHGNYPDLSEEELFQVYKHSLQYALLGHANVVLDRCWISEPVYGAVFRNGKSRIWSGRMAHLESLLTVRPSVVVHLRPSLDMAWGIVSARYHDEMAQHRAEIAELIKLYDLTPWPDQTIHIDRDARTPQELADIVMGELHDGD